MQAPVQKISEANKHTNLKDSRQRNYVQDLAIEFLAVVHKGHSQMEISDV